MPAKPRHKKGKLSSQARRRRQEMRRSAGVPPSSPALAPPSIAPSAVARPLARPAKAASAAPGPTQQLAHLQVGTELRTIGVITAVIVVLLVVLSFVIR